MAITAKPLETLYPTSEGRWESLRRTLGNAMIITRREVRDSFRDWRILGPIVVLTFLFPSLAQFVAGRFAEFLAGYGAELIGERTIPFMLMIVGFFPISISLVIALETFVGEKERRSLEPLLSTPLTNTELYIGKMLAAMIPPLISSFGGMAVYLSSLVLGSLAWRPPAMLIVQIVLLTTVQALVMVTGAVVVSSQTTSTRAANLLASFIIIPMTLLIQGESAIMFLAQDAESPKGIGALWAIIIGMVVVVILLLRVGNSIFNREELLGRTIDQINIRGMFSKIWKWTRAIDDKGTPARNLFEWYRYGVWGAVRNLGAAAWITTGVFVLALIAGLVLGTRPEWQLPVPKNTDLSTTAAYFDRYLNVGMPGIPPDTNAAETGVPSSINMLTFIVWQNGRILLAASILGMISFGVGALILTPAVYVILGYLYVQIRVAGLDPMFLVAGIVPHGIVEIPMIVLAAAASLRLGAVITRLPYGMTVGAAWSKALSDTLKIALGLIIPGLFVAAFIEAYITPHIILAVLSR